jgi:hypothetical protein
MNVARQRKGGRHNGQEKQGWEDYPSQEASQEDCQGKESRQETHERPQDHGDVITPLR